jgi:hypothetical protein
MRFTITAFLLLSVVVMGVFIPSAYGQRYYLDHFYIAPPEPEPETTAKTMHDKRYPLPEDTVRAWVNTAMPTRVVEAFNANDTATKQMLQEAPPTQVAVHHPLDEEAASLFGAGQKKGNRQVHLGAIASHGAYALRLRVNLMGLRSGDALWVLDAEGAAAFGPFTAGTADAENCWLPVTLGDSVVLALESKDAVLPLLTVLDVAHFYKPIVEKQQLTPLACNIPIAQETNATAQEISASVGRLLVPFTNGTGLCTTTLLNSEKRTDGAPTPYIISAWHCFGDGVKYEGVTVYWDYRSPNTDGSDIPDLYDLDWNMGADLLDHSFSLDAALLQLKSQVSVGPYGRAWVGWDSEPPAQGASVQDIHHPVGADMKISSGRITSDSTDTCMNVTCSTRYDQQIEVLWSDGVTEQGSSGSALLMRSNNLRLAGVLSNGTVHSCTDSSNNFDNFGPFHAFFPQVGCYLANDYVCAEPYEPAATGCFLFRKGFSLEMLQNLRTFRDETLMKFPIGKQLVSDYYTHATSLEKLVDKSPAARVIFHGLLTLGSAWGAAL